MIERLYLQNNLSFSEVDIEFDAGLVVFTGAQWYWKINTL